MKEMCTMDGKIIKFKIIEEGFDRFVVYELFEFKGCGKMKAVGEGFTSEDIENHLQNSLDSTTK